MNTMTAPLPKSLTNSAVRVGVQETQDTAEEIREAQLEAIREAENKLMKNRSAVSFEKFEEWIDSWDTKNELPIPEPDVFF